VAMLARSGRSEGRRMRSSNNPRYWAFISYSRQDENIARWLQGRLERYSIPRAIRSKVKIGVLSRTRLAPVFRDVENCRPRQILVRLSKTPLTTPSF
jgi:hypothetical protein